VPVRGGGFLETRGRGGNAAPLNVPSLIGRAREGSRETWLRIWLHSTRNLRPKSSRTYRRLVSDFRWVERECLPWRRHAP